MNKKARIKFVKKANKWCKTTITVNSKGKPKQTQKWFDTKEEAEK